MFNLLQQHTRSPRADMQRESLKPFTGRPSHGAIGRSRTGAPQRCSSLSVLACAVLALATATAPAQAADRWWTFIGGCGTADWFGTANGQANSQGTFTCWSPLNGGFSGISAPTPVDNTFIVNTTATSTLLVNFANGARTGVTGSVANLSMYGSASFAAGLAVDRLALNALNINVGGPGNLLGRMDQSGGAVTVIGNVNLNNGDYNFSGGTLVASQLNVVGQLAASRMAQTGGTLTLNALTLSNAAGREASFSQSAGTANVGTVTVGQLSGSGVSQVTVRGSSTRLNGSSSASIGLLGDGQMSVLQGARVTSNTLAVGTSPGVDGLAMVGGAGSLWTVAGNAVIGQLGTGRLVVSDGGAFTTSNLSVNNAPALFGGALGATLDVSGTGSTVRVTDTLTLGDLARSRMSVRDGATVSSQSAKVGTSPSFRGNVDLSGGALWSVQSGLIVGDGGVGVVAASGAAQLTSATATVSNGSTSRGVVQLSGAGTQWVNSGALFIGNLAPAVVTVADGALLTSGATVVGLGSGGTGELTLNGAGTRWQANNGFKVGALASGRLSVDTGARVDSTGVVRVGEMGTALGAISLSGANTRWEQAGDVTLGWVGVGALTVSTGAVAQLNGALKLAELARSEGNATASGAGTVLNVTQPLSVGVLGAAVLTFQAGATGQIASLVAGQSSGGVGDVVLRGAGTQVAAPGSFTLGQDGLATLNVNTGAWLQSGAASLGVAASARGSATVDGAGSQWLVTGALTAGVGGTGVLTVSNGGLVQASGLTTTGGRSSQVVLDAGTLRSGTVLLGLPGQLDWRSGTLHVTGSNGVALNGLELPSLLRLSAGQDLQVDNTLQVTRDSVLLLAGGTLRAGTLQLQNGVLASTAGGDFALQMGGISNLVATGQVSASVQGGTGLSQRIVATGPLTLGQLNRNDGYAFGGWLSVDSQQVLLLDRDWADLGASTTLNAGGQLVTVNGARLAATGSLLSNGAASIQGRFLNNGLVTAQTGELSFFDDVSGAGSFAGAVRFLAGYAPGNSTAQVSFNGGLLSLGEHARLTLEINGSQPGSGFDQLLDIGTLSFAGALTLDFGAGFTPTAGTRLRLLNFGSFTGALDASHITINGIDARLLDLSQLPVDGSIAVVPEPGSWALLLAGLGVVGLLGRRRSGAALGTR